MLLSSSIRLCTFLTKKDDGLSISEEEDRPRLLPSQSESNLTTLMQPHDGTA